MLLYVIININVKYSIYIYMHMMLNVVGRREKRRGEREYMMRYIKDLLCCFSSVFPLVST